MTYVIGLTGSIGMGKSTTATMFADAGIPVWDADDVVRRLYRKGGAAAFLVAQHYPDAIEDGDVSRAKLRTLIASSPDILDHLNTLVHPLVRQNRKTFLTDTVSPIVLLDIPLLFETSADGECDGIVVVSAPADVQKQRVLARGEMSEADFELIVSRQMPDAAKRAKADWIVDTQTLDAARQSVANILSDIKQGLPDA